MQIDYLLRFGEVSWNTQSPRRPAVRILTPQMARRLYLTMRWASAIVLRIVRISVRCH